MLELVHHCQLDPVALKLIAMMPDPTTVARRRAVPTASAVMRRARSVGPCGSAIAPRLVEQATLLAEEAICHLASTGVVRAEDQDAFAADVHLTVSTTVPPE